MALILGIDPGLQTTGFGVVDVAGAELRYVASGTISTGHLDTRALPARLQVLFQGLAEVAQRHPRLSLDLTLTDRFVDLVDEGVDIAVRIAHGRKAALIVQSFQFKIFEVSRCCLKMKPFVQKLRLKP